MHPHLSPGWPMCHRRVCSSGCRPVVGGAARYPQPRAGMRPPYAPWPVDVAPTGGHTSARGLHFHSAPGLSTQTPAYMLDSLVRVSRRAGLQDHANLHNNASYHAPRLQRTCLKVVHQSCKSSQLRSLMPHFLDWYQQGLTTQSAATNQTILPIIEARLTWKHNE